MSASSPDSNVCSSSDDDSELNFIPGIYQPTEAEIQASADGGEGDDHMDGFSAYADEPLADTEWTEEYEKNQAEKEQRLESLKDRLSGKESLSNW